MHETPLEMSSPDDAPAGFGYKRAHRPPPIGALKTHHIRPANEREYQMHMEFGEGLRHGIQCWYDP
jgi:hypothetical protein